MVASSNVRRGVDRLAHLLEGAATADIGDGLVDVLVGRLRPVLQKCCHRHDHAALAIAALRNIVLDPGLLHLVQHTIGREALDRGDLLAAGFADRDAAGARRDAVDMHGAGAAFGDAATIFGSGQAGIFPDSPEQRRVGFDVQIESFAIDSEVCHRDPLFGPSTDWASWESWTGIWNLSNQDSAPAKAKIFCRNRNIFDLAVLPRGCVDQALRCDETVKRRKLITHPSAAKPAPSASASAAPSRPARLKHRAASAAPVVCPIRRAVATMPLALPLRCGGALDIMAFILGV